MPKQVWKIERFEGGLDTFSDPRDIDDTELTTCTDMVVHNTGKVRLMGAFEAHAAGTNSTQTNAGYGLFYFSHDRKGAQISSGDFSGTHTGSNNAGTLVDTSATWIEDSLIGFTINNTTDGSSGTITDNSNNTVTASLSGGTDSDWDSGDAYTITGMDDDGEQYLLMADTDAAAEIDMYTFSSDNWATSIIDLGSTTGMKPTYYVADGNVRISDGNFGAANQSKWYGYIKNTHFNGITPGGLADDYDQWYSKNIDLAKPTRGLYGDLQWTDSGGNTTTTDHPTSTAFAGMHDEIDDNNDYIALSHNGSNSAALVSTATDDVLTTATNSGNWSGEAMRLYPPAGKGFNISIETSSNGTWREADYEIGTTFIYQGNQESNIFENVGNGVSMDAGKGWSVYVQCTSPFDPFIIGGRAYIRKKDSDDPWTLLLDIDLKDGVRKNLTSTHTAWSLQNATGIGVLKDNAYCYVGNIEIEDPSPWTYEAINGYEADESIDIGAAGEGFKTAVVANRQVYVGNVRRELPNIGTATQGDAMYKSMPGKFDVFPISRKIEASIQDGDEIVKLEEYADRILQFKKTKMHLINVSQDMEFLEDTFTHKGVLCPGAVCKTDFGIVWANEVGAYFYDGKTVKNLLEKRSKQVISDWSSFVGSNPQVGYIPKHRQVIFTMSADATPAGDIYLFDMVTQSWVYGDSKVTDTDLQSNFVNDINGDLVYHEEAGAVKKWNDTAVASSNTSLTTKDIDFGDPSRRKKIYKVYVSYKGDASNVEARYGTDGNTTLSGVFFRTNADGSTALTQSGTYLAFYQGSVGTNDWVNAELKPTSSINNVKSFRLQLKANGSVSADFEINDITIVYRMKGIK